MVNNVDTAIAIAEEGMTFDIIRDSKLFPPRDILNSFFECGVDDVEHELQLGWEPFSLSEDQYQQFLKRCVDSFGPLAVESLGAASYSPWFCEAVNRQ